MNERLDRYFDSLFKDIPNTNEVRELRQEIYQNTLDKYTDLIAQGKSEDASFNQAVSGIGDIEELFGKSFQLGNSSVYEQAGKADVFSEDLYDDNEISINKILCSALIVFSVFVYGISLLPLATFNGICVTLAAMAFATGCIVFSWRYRIKKDRCTEVYKKMQFEKGSGYTKQMFSRQRFLSAFAFSMSVMLYILALAPLSIIETYGGAAFTLSCFILCCAIGATYFYKRVKLIFEKSKILSQYNMPAPFLFICKVYRKIGNFICDNLKLSLYIVLNAAVLVTALFAYFILSYDTGAWGITWIIFVMAIIMNRIIKNFLNLLFLKEADKYEGNLH